MNVRAVLFLWCTALWACGPARQLEEEHGKPSSPPTARDYCETIQPFFCSYYVRCGRMAVDDVKQCKAVFLEACNARYEPSYVSLQDAGLLKLSTDGVEQCEAHLQDVPCEEQVLDLDGPCASMWQGKQPAGSACGFDVESFVCAPGTACSLGLDFCGTCESVVEDGARCDVDGVTCARTSTCKDGVCVALVPVGEACSPDERCVLGASCTGSLCQGPAYVGVGDPCDQAHRCPYASACLDGSCVRSSELDGACGTDRACDSGFCDDGQCVALRDQGAVCDAGAQCQTGACINGACSVVPGQCFEGG